MKLDENKFIRQIVEIPGLAYFKNTIINELEVAKMVLIFVDSSDSKSIQESSDYIYDILNNDNFDENSNLVIVCSKSDSKFSKSKNIIESELTKEIDSRKLIKQKNNLEESNDQNGKLFVSFYLYSFLKLSLILKLLITFRLFKLLRMIIILN